ncbi:PREDICTED: uncharacterized protein LOC109178502 [Ipomoea nil]|uniref:uncharacterized protein LOC109178502 n=1 Tax=Ipomoea nil TaxID=35883 RepID=UPI0009014D57|nr:PREDICTED: uncharacterized protein LOC109178502 [Ipomoea nil]
MGGTSSKGERSEALRLCKERKRFIKKAIDSRYALAAAHVSYVQSLRNIGIGLGRYAEAEVLIEPSISTPPTDPSASPLHIPGGTSDSPVLNGSPVSPLTARLSYMKSGGTSAVTVKVTPPVKNMYVEDGGFRMPPPPPPPLESGSSWDFFDPAGNAESFRFAVDNDGCMNFDDMEMNGDGDMVQEEFMTPNSDTRSPKYSKLEVDNSHPVTPQGAKSNSHNGLGKRSGMQQSGSKGDKSLVGKDMYAEREDPSEFITHRAKDFLSSVKDIENQFFRASESGKEVSRMLEASKIRVGYSEAKGKLSASIYLTSIGGACCRRGTANISEGEQGHGTKVITWKRTTSSRSSSSRNPLNAKDDNDDSGSDFVEDFCMIAGSHSSTLDRLYAWERKLYDEVKAIELIRREYDRKRVQLRHQFAKDLSSQVIDKTRAVVKDLHSRIRVALYAVDSISKRIEKMRDEELLPQLLELIQGLIRMWRSMLECHHTQYITISLAYHGKAASGRSSPRGEDQKQIVAQLLDEVECFGLSFADWINSQTSYVEALNSWLQNCILQPPERKSRRAFSPRRVIAPPIFALCRDWSAGIQSLPSRELNDAIRAFLYELRHSGEQRHEEQQCNNEEIMEKDGGDKKHERCSNLSRMHASLTIVLDRLNKFSEASLKMCEDVRQKCDAARNTYVNYRPPPRSFSV